MLFRHKNRYGPGQIAKLTEIYKETFALPSEHQLSLPAVTSTNNENGGTVDWILMEKMSSGLEKNVGHITQTIQQD